MPHRHLIWNKLSSTVVKNRRIFTVTDCVFESSEGAIGTFTVLDAPDWACVIPIVEDGPARRFVMVRQFRFGSASISMEFPGGVVDPGETPLEAVTRELREETGYVAERIEPLGWVWTNPAFLDNKFHVFVARGCRKAHEQALDEHEIVDVELRDEADVLAGIGNDPFSHALMVDAAFLYVRKVYVAGDKS
jgi:8-oxo-dGTP pyrophosphatase MutT (NUDIX family)